MGFSFLKREIEKNCSISYIFGGRIKFSKRPQKLNNSLIIWVGIEPAIKLLQSPALPLGYPASQRTRHLRAGACSFKFFQQKPESQKIAPKTKRIAKRKAGTAVSRRPQLSPARSPHRLTKGKGKLLTPTHPPGAHAGTRMSRLLWKPQQGDTPRLVTT